MSGEDDRRRSLSGQPRSGYEVGYAKPPLATRFAPGRSGNPKGRPRGSKKQAPAEPSLNEERPSDRCGLVGPGCGGPVREGIATAIVWTRRAHEGERSARKQGQPKRSKLDPHRDYLLDLIEQGPDMTVAKMQVRLASEAGGSASVGTIWTCLDWAGLMFKRTAHASEQDSPDVLSRR